MPAVVKSVPVSSTLAAPTSVQPEQETQEIQPAAPAVSASETSVANPDDTLVQSRSGSGSGFRSDSVRSGGSADGGPLFRKKLPSLRATVFPVRFLGHWFSRRFNVFPKKWNDTNGDSAGNGVDSARSNNSSSSQMDSIKTGSTSRRRGPSDPEVKATLVLEGIIYGESPRFRPQEQALYFADMYGKQILRVDLTSGEREVVYEDASDFLSGIGWLPDGRLLIVSMNKRAVLAHDRDTAQTSLYADVSAVTQTRANDMVVSTTGRAYLGNFGFPVENFAASCTTTLVSVAPEDQQVRVEASGLMFPNGAVITPDGSTLIVAETFDGQLTAFTIRVEDGRLTNRRVWAKLGVPIDGICLDAEGCVWASVPQVGLYETSGGLLRVREGGVIVNMLGFGCNGIRAGVFACQLATDASTGEHKLYFMEAASCKESDIFKKSTDRNQLGKSSSASASSDVTTTRNSALKCVPVRVGPARSPDNADYSGGYC